MSFTDTRSFLCLPDIATFAAFVDPLSRRTWYSNPFPYSRIKSPRPISFSTHTDGPAKKLKTTMSIISRYSGIRLNAKTSSATALISGLGLDLTFEILSRQHISRYSTFAPQGSLETEKTRLNHHADLPSTLSAFPTLEFPAALTWLITLALFATLPLFVVRISTFAKPVLTHEAAFSVRFSLIYRSQSQEMVSSSVHSINLGPKMLIKSIALIAVFGEALHTFICKTHFVKHCTKHCLERIIVLDLEPGNMSGHGMLKTTLPENTGLHHHCPKLYIQRCRA